MAVAHDAISESHTGTTGSTSAGTFSWTHTPTGTPKGVMVVVFTNDSVDLVTSVTYNGVYMNKVCRAAVDSAGEFCHTQLYFLGAGVPTGAQTVEVTRTGTSAMYAAAVTVTAGTDETEAVGFVYLEGDGTLAEQSVTSTNGTACRYAAITSGLSAVPGAGASSTSLGTGATIDYGVRVTGFVRETTTGSGARNIGFSSGTSDDRAAIHWAVQEVPDQTYTDTPLVRGVSESANGTAAIELNMPSNAVVGDLLIALIATADQAIDTNDAAWTECTDSPVSNSTNSRVTAFWKICEGNDDTLTTDSGTFQLGSIIAFKTGTFDASPFDVTATSTGTGLFNGSCAGDTTTVAHCVVLVASAADNSAASNSFSNWTNADLTSVTERVDSSRGAATDSLGAATGVKAAAGAFTATTYSHYSSTTHYSSLTLTVRPPQTSGSLVFRRPANTGLLMRGRR